MANRTPFLRLRLRTTTPIFCRGVEPDAAELRATAFKGQLRYWLRAWHPWATRPEGDQGYSWTEGRLMGGVGQGEGQCPFTTRVEWDTAPKTAAWQAVRTQASKAVGRDISGIQYLGFPFKVSKGSPHHCVLPGARFQVTHHLNRRVDPEERSRIETALVASWWLLAHYGGIGSRARRGFGSMTLESWEGQLDRHHQLPVPYQSKDPQDWSQAMNHGLLTLYEWLPARAGWPENYPDPHIRVPAPEIDRQADALVLPDADDWSSSYEVLNEVGKILSEWRRDYGRDENPKAHAPSGRVAFGLPLNVGGQQWVPRLPGSGEDGERHASPLHISISEFHGGHGICWTRLAGPIPGQRGYRVKPRGASESHRGEVPDALEAFMKDLMRE